MDGWIHTYLQLVTAVAARTRSVRAQQPGRIALRARAATRGGGGGGSGGGGGGGGSGRAEMCEHPVARRHADEDRAVCH